MSEHVPLRDAHCFTDLRHITGIMLDPCGVRCGWLTSLPASALVEKNQLTPSGQRRECWPEHLVSEMKAAIDAEKRKRSIDRRTRVHREVETSRVDGAI